MAKPLLTKSIPKRLKPLSKPMVWVPAGVFVLLCLGLWQYYAQQPVELLEPAGVGASSETESSALSEIDTLELLLESSRGAANPAAGNRQVAKDLPSDLALTTPTGQSTSEPSSQSSGQSDPFAAYRAEYQFQSGSNSAVDPDRGTQPATPANGRFNFGAGLVNPTAPSTNSALSEALKRQQAVREQLNEQGRSQAVPGEVAPNQPNAQSGPNRANIPGSRAANTTSRNQSAGSPNSDLGSGLGGSTTAPYRSITPSTSPPVGTTGYQLPTTVPQPSSTLPATQPYQNLSSTSRPSSPTSDPSAADTPSVLYTPPTFTQPDQGRPINPRQ